MSIVPSGSIMFMGQTYNVGQCAYTNDLAQWNKDLNDPGNANLLSSFTALQTDDQKFCQDLQATDPTAYQALCQVRQDRISGNGNAQTDFSKFQALLKANPADSNLVTELQQVQSDSKAFHIHLKDAVGTTQSDFQTLCSDKKQSLQSLISAGTIPAANTTAASTSSSYMGADSLDTANDPSSTNNINTAVSPLSNTNTVAASGVTNTSNTPLTTTGGGTQIGLLNAGSTSSNQLGLFNFG